MKLTVLTNSTATWRSDELKKAAQDRSVDINFLHIDSYNRREAFAKQLGDVTLLQSTDLCHYTERGALLYYFSHHTRLINPGLATHRLITSKLYQQTMIELEPNVDGIPTYYFHSKKELHTFLKEGTIQYPFVLKKFSSSLGKGVYLIQNEQDLHEFPDKDITSVVCQNFIKNSGDYRVFVIGNDVVAIMKRIAVGGDFRNNISLGGTAEPVTDPTERETLSRIALDTTTLFHLDICGVDIMFDEETNTYRVIEINTIPGWQGLQSTVPFSIAEKIIDFAQSLHEPTR